MAKLDDLEFRITASTDLLKTQLDRGAQQIQNFSQQTDRHLSQLHNRFEEVSRKLRQVFAFVGIDVGIRAFKSWIEDATNINKLTDEQYQKLRGVREGMAALSKSSDELAQSVATRLAPALEKAAKFWADLLHVPTQGEQADRSIDIINAQILSLHKLNEEQAKNIGKKNFLGLEVDPQAEEIIANRQKLIDRLEAQRAQLTKVTDSDLKFGNLAGFEVGTGSSDTGLPAEIKQITLPNFNTDQAFEDLEKQMSKFINDAKLPDFKFPKIDLENFDDGIKEMEKKSRAFAKELGDGLHNSLVEFILDGEHKFGEFIKRLAANVAVSGLFDLISGGLSGSKGSAGQFFSEVFGRGRAGGGPVAAGIPYIVGEHGPELFLPNVSGRIDPSPARGGPTVNQYFNLDAGLAPILAAQSETIVRVAASSAYDAVMQTLGGRR